MFKVGVFGAQRLLGLRLQEFMLQGLGNGFRSLGFRGLGFRVWSLCFRVVHLPNRTSVGSMCPALHELMRSGLCPFTFYYTH